MKEMIIMPKYFFLNDYKYINNVFIIGLIIELKKLSIHGSLVEPMVEPMSS